MLYINKYYYGNHRRFPFFDNIKKIPRRKPPIPTCKDNTYYILHFIQRAFKESYVTSKPPEKHNKKMRGKKAPIH